LPLRNENGKELPVSRAISGGFNEALGFFRKKKKIVRPTILGKAKDWGRGQRAEGRGQRAEGRGQRAGGRVKRSETQFEWLEIRGFGILASRH
jgi:hypothetical protein